MQYMASKYKYNCLPLIYSEYETIVSYFRTCNDITRTGKTFDPNTTPNPFQIIISTVFARNDDLQ